MQSKKFFKQVSLIISELTCDIKTK